MKRCQIHTRRCKIFSIQLKAEPTPIFVPESMWCQMKPIKKIWFLISCCSSPFRLSCFCQGNQETKEWSDLQSRSELRGGDRPQDWCRTSILQAPWFFTAQWCPKRRVLGTLTSQERHRQEIISSQERLQGRQAQLAGQEEALGK